MIEFTDDPVRDYDAWVRQEEKRMEAYPICDECGYRIVDDYVWKVGRETFCQECAERLFRVSNIEM